LRPEIKIFYQLRPKMSASCVSVASQNVCFMRTRCVPSCLLHVYQLRPKISASCLSVASQNVCFTHQLRPKMSVSCVSVTTQDICFIPVSYVPRCLLHASVASQDVCFIRISCVPRYQRQTNALHRKKKSGSIESNSLKVLTQLHCTSLYRQFCVQV
jgi:hypothetical protein